MAANSATGDLTPTEAKPTPRPNRPLEPAESLTPRLWRVVSQDGSTCDLHLAAGPPSPREDTTAERHEEDAVRQQGQPDEPLSEPKASFSDLAFEEAAVKSRQCVASFSPTSVKLEAGTSRPEAGQLASEHEETVGRTTPPTLPQPVVDLSESPAPMMLKPGALDPNLCHLIRRWLVLPPRVREAVVALIDAAASR